MDKPLALQFFSLAKEYIDILSATDRATIAAHIEYVRFGEFEPVRTKQLRGSIRELIVGHHRLIYFQFDSNLYFVNGFRKKTTKTPKLEIDYAEKIYKMIKNYR